MSYVLENESEFERLERQSTFPAYDISRELRSFKVERNDRILDVGCGSGIVTRFLASAHPDAEIVGCDSSEERLVQARESARALRNIRFCGGNITALPFPSGFFDSVVCRYVLEHLSAREATEAMRELFRTLRPGGVLCAIDFDGAYHNLFPQPPLVAEVIAKADRSDEIDLKVGRKIPQLMHVTGFVDIQREIEVINAEGDCLDQEVELTSERLRNALPFLIRLTGSDEQALTFTQQYLDAMRAPGSVLFFNKFIVAGRKPDRRAILRVVK